MRTGWFTLATTLLVSSLSAIAQPGAAPSPQTSAPAAAVSVVDGGDVAVLPFINISGQAEDDWIGDGIAETLLADLQARSGWSVTAPERVLAVADGTELDAAATVSLGRQLGVRWVIAGGYQRLGDQLRITARLIDPVAQVVTRTVKADGKLDDLFALQDRIATELTVAGSSDAPAPVRQTPSVADRGEGARTQPFSPSVGTGAEGDPQLTQDEVSGTIVLPDGPDALEAAGPGRPGGAAAVAPGVSAGILTDRPSVSLIRTPESPIIDGILDDAVWQQAVRITEFVQQSPLEGAPATEETEVLIAYDDDHIYFGLYAHYSDPGTVRANRVDRDQASYYDDTINIYFDTFLDQQRAYVFSINGYGVQGDSLLDTGGGGGSRGGSRGGGRGGGFSGGRSGFSGVPTGDRSWDALFESGGILVADGWTAEMAIPFKSLRYPVVGDQAHRWGFQITRRIRDKDETVVWSPISRDVSGFLPQMGLLDGMTGLSTSRNLEILPTVTAIQAGRLDQSTAAFPTESQPEGGINLKYGLTSNLTLDFTYNPDFSQIESDRPQIEVNQRFPLFFPELRPFFLEGQEIFSVPGPVNFVNTRTIVDPRYGAKVTGKIGNTTLGLLFANDEAPGNLDDSSDPAFGKTANVLMGRVRYDLYAESYLGAIVTDREFLSGHSRLGGVDGNFRLNDSTSFGFRAIGSQNRDLSDLDTSGEMFDAVLTSQGRNLSYSLGGYSIDPEFDSAVGFVRRRDIRLLGGQVGYRWWPESWLINWGPEALYTRNYNFEDILEDEVRQLGVNFSFAKNIRFGTSVNRDMERFGGINFDKTRYSTNLFVSTFNKLSVGGFFSYGDQVFFGTAPFLGSGSQGRVFLTVRPLNRLQSQINITTSRLIDPFDETEVFDVKIYRALNTYQFTDRLLLRNILEYNTFSKTVGANVLFTYRVNSGTVFFIGYDDRYQQGDLILDDGNDLAYFGNQELFTTDLVRTNRAFFTKISYLFRY